jgi:hypothetical protein
MARRPALDQRPCPSSIIGIFYEGKASENGGELLSGLGVKVTGATAMCDGDPWLVGSEKHGAMLDLRVELGGVDGIGAGRQEW